MGGDWGDRLGEWDYMNATDIIAMAKDRGFDIYVFIEGSYRDFDTIEGSWSGEKYFYIFRNWVLIGYVNSSIKSEELDCVLTEYALKAFQ